MVSIRNSFIDWGVKLPPLNALRAFECAARTGSFAAAGTELGVTSAAVSQHVRHLEDWLGRTLFTRRANRISLTDAGRDYYMNAASALTEIATFTAHLTEAQATRPLVISASPALSQLWLPAKLAQFSKLHPKTAVTLREESDVADLERNGIDLRVGYGENHPEYRSQPIFSDVLMPVGAPGAEPLGSLRRITVQWGHTISSVPGWRQWEEGAGVHPEGEAVPALSAPSVPAALALAEAGLGAALLPQEVIAQVVKAERLVSLHPYRLPMGQPFVAVSAHYKRGWRRLQALIAVLLG